MRPTRLPASLILMAATLVLGTGCGDLPTDNTRGAPRGVLTLPAGSFTALVEFRAAGGGTVDSAGIGFGDLRVYQAAPSADTLRLLVLSTDKALPEALPIRVFTSASAVTATLLETSDQSGQVEKPAAPIPLH